MSRLRRPFLYDRFFFVTVKLLPSESALKRRSFARLAVSLSPHAAETRLSAHRLWVFLPNHWHAIVLLRLFYPPHDLYGALRRWKKVRRPAINVRQARDGRKLWQERFFDRTLRTVREYRGKRRSIHSSEPRAPGIGRKRPENWKWSSMAEFAGVSGDETGRAAADCASTSPLSLRSPRPRLTRKRSSVARTCCSMSAAFLAAGTTCPPRREPASPCPNPVARSCISIPSGFFCRRATASRRPAPRTSRLRHAKLAG